ncbi:MAG TPA: phosphodiester glycosidase family protein [Puia sp.]
MVKLTGIILAGILVSWLTASAILRLHVPDDTIISYTVDLKKEDLQLYWKDDSGHIFRSIQHLKDFLEHQHKRLLFAMNGGMFNADNSPVGLFIQHKMTLIPLDTGSGAGNFYLKPNGVFYIRRNTAAICPTPEFKNDGQVTFATQSGPMLLIDGAFHTAFKKGSTNTNIRNGVGILPDNKVIFAMSRVPINFYDLASYFKGMGCQNALYLDGFVSRTYLPEKNWTQTDGNFGVIIGVAAPE